LYAARGSRPRAFPGSELKAAPVRLDPEQRGMGVASTGVFVTA